MGRYRLSFKDKKGKDVMTNLDVRAERMNILPPFGPKNKKYTNLEVSVITAKERKVPKGRDRIDWKLMTDIKLGRIEEVVEKLEWYALRWKIEVFFKILKSGCRVHDLKLRNAESLSKIISIQCLVAWRVFWMTMISRTSSKTPPLLGLTKIEKLVLEKLKPSKENKSLSDYLIKIAKLGGYLGRSSDAPPGNTVIWRGISKLQDIVVGIEIGKNIYG